MAVETTIIPSLRQVIYGTYASFPSGGLTAGDLAWATDRKCLYRWSGSAWETIGISSRNGDYANIGDPADYPESSLYQADDYDRLYMVVSAAWKQISAEPGLIKWQVGDVVIVAADTEKLLDTTSYTKLKEIRIASGGTIRVKWEMYTSSADRTCYAKIYKNGSPHGTEYSTTATSYQAFSEDLVFAQDDLVQLYGKRSESIGDNYYKNFRLCANKVHVHTVVLDA